MTDDLQPLPDPGPSDPCAEPRLDPANLAQIAAWIAEWVAAAASSGVIGNAVYDYLRTYRRGFGKRRLMELQDQVYAELRRVKRRPNVSDADLRLRAERLFQDLAD